MCAKRIDIQKPEIRNHQGLVIRACTELKHSTCAAYEQNYKAKTSKAHSGCVRIGNPDVEALPFVSLLTLPTTLFLGETVS